MTVAEAIAQYMEVTQLDLSTRRTYEGYISRTIVPALGAMELRKLRGPLLDTFYSRLRRCGNLACNRRPFMEHSSFPPLEVAAGSRTAWQEVAKTVRDAIRSGQLAAGVQLPSAREISDRYGLRLTAAQHALTSLAEGGFIEVHQGRRSVVCAGFAVDSACAVAADAARLLAVDVQAACLQADGGADDQADSCDLVGDLRRCGSLGVDRPESCGIGQAAEGVAAVTVLAGAGSGRQGDRLCPGSWAGVAGALLVAGGRDRSAAG